MTTYYDKSTLEANRYQDYLITKMISHGIIIMPYVTKTFQCDVGESYTRHEIKKDNNFRETGNLYIEYAEKTNKDNDNWIPSGIKRKDNTIFYLIGDEKGCYLLLKKTLQTLLVNRNYKEVICNAQTSKGYLLPIKDIAAISEYFSFE